MRTALALTVVAASFVWASGCASGRAGEDAGRARDTPSVEVPPDGEVLDLDAGERADTGVPLDAPTFPDVGSREDAYEDCGLCAPFTACIAGRCEPYSTCTTSADCPAATVCRNMRCVPLDVDVDGDGSVARNDCDESDPAVHPGAAELCNGIDDNCDAVTDPGRTTYYRDADGDGAGSASMTMLACAPPSGWVTTSGDCNDGSGAVRPGATDVCNGVDDDCAGGDRCPTGCRAPVAYGGHFYVYCHTGQPWTTARDRCTAGGMVFVQIDSSGENSFVRGIVEDSVAWIGANDRTTEGTWRWVGSDDAVSYRNWLSGEPNDDGGEDCGRMASSDGRWIDTECGSSYDWTCETP